VVSFFLADDTERKLTCVDILASSHPQEWHMIQELSKGLNVKSVKRIQNRHLYCSFSVQKEQMEEFFEEQKQKNTHIWRSKQFIYDPDDCWVFHGTDKENAAKINNQGFDRAFAGKNACMYGKGTYFHRDPNYSLKYSNNKTVYLAQVLIGAYHKGTKDAQAPNEIAGTQQRYHSTVDDVDTPQIFVSYKDFRCYPSYLVEFE
jgi:poly [ADP-ribose] polymerase 10/14/15